MLGIAGFSAQAALVPQDSLGMADKKKTFAEVMREGELDFHFRSFYMATSNKGELLNYSTLGVGAGIGYTSPSYKGFYGGFSGFFVFQLFENNLRIPDPITGSTNRYEILLYDMNDLSNSRDLDRLDNLFLAYKKEGTKITFGRQRINTPLLNEQDNRMRPNIFSGITWQQKWKNWELLTAWYQHVSMRGTVDWYSISESFGVYPFGRNVFGTSSQYKGNINSKGIGLIGLKWQKDSNRRIQAWNYLAENVFNMTWLQGDWVIDGPKISWDFGTQGFYQTTIRTGGNPDPLKSYIMPGEKSYGFGAKIGLHDDKQAFSLNVLGISDSGRFLFPREWGREGFYASLPRERFEGNGGVMAISAKYDWRLVSKGLNGTLAASSVKNPDINDFGLNKYGVPSYYHFVGMVDYPLTGELEGLDLKFLVVNKTARHAETIPDAFRINRVDMWNLNLILDYRF
ncbi:OprD family outer membrane porin [Pararhodonellum marinum]|uniref:OprD family outer membrane porin n=1 Tax=Pararhodonellum marinum TaxID=2755358 RepID=UPI001E29EAB3|nr:OprD family outer membrane porin [Pararhodonellum marinum]